MSNPNDGGPAFPRCLEDYYDPDIGDLIKTPGLSKREWFAGQAMAGMLANPDRSGESSSYAEDAYAYADAMIAEGERSIREKQLNP